MVADFSTFPEFQSGLLNKKVIVTGGAVGSSARHRCCCFDECLEVDRCWSLDDRVNEQAELELSRDPLVCITRCSGAR